MASGRYGGHRGHGSWRGGSDVDILSRDWCERQSRRDDGLQESGAWDLQGDDRNRDCKGYTMEGARELGCCNGRTQSVDGCLRRFEEREPGELSSGGGSDVEDGFKKSADVDEASSGKKRKFSPIVLDLDDKGCVIDLKSKNEDGFPLPLLQRPVVGGSQERSPAKRVKTSEKSSAAVDVDASIVSFQNKLFENGDLLEALGVDDMPARTISFSRWANDVIEDDEDDTYEPGEVISLEGSDASLSRSSGSGGLCQGTSVETLDSMVDGACAFGEEPCAGSFEVDLEGCRVKPTGSAEPPQARVNMLQGCRSVDEFEKLSKINEGTYGIVYKARDKKTGEIVALKKVKMEKEQEGFPLTSLREINVLSSLHHPSIVQVKEVVMGRELNDIFMVMEYMDFDLKCLLGTMKKPFHLSEIKCLFLQLLVGVKHLHDNWVLHRDLKTSNLLYNNLGELKICDFGLSRQYGTPLKPCTQLVVTLWYRAPELLLGANKYSTAIDMWSLGCIMAEVLSNEPLFPGKNEVDQLDKIFGIMGTPDDKTWPGFPKLPGAKVKFAKKPFKLHEKFHRMSAKSFLGYPLLSDAGFDLLNKLLTYDPEKRISAEDALNHPWFHESPLPTSKDFMPTFPPQPASDRCKQRITKGSIQLEKLKRRDTMHLGLLLLHGGDVLKEFLCFLHCKVWYWCFDT